MIKAHLLSTYYMLSSSSITFLARWQKQSTEELEKLSNIMQETGFKLGHFDYTAQVLNILWHIAIQENANTIKIQSWMANMWRLKKNF